jgi:uncharacterized repeat protein (TIGR01451 family)
MSNPIFKKLFGCWGGLLAVTAILFFTGRSAKAQGLGSNCTVTILNRAIQVDADGSFVVRNIPYEPGFYRLRVVCRNADGTSTLGQSGFFRLSADGITDLPPIQFGSLDPLPVGMELFVSKQILRVKGETVQFTAFALLPDGSYRDVSTETNGTLWTSSNTNIASINTEGLVTAHTRGNVIIGALNEGVLATFAISSVIPNDADGDGITDEWEIANGLNPNNPSDAAQDLDGDSLTNLQEYQLGTNPRLADTDGDGLSDGREVTLATNPLKADTDGDGITDGQEVLRGLNPLLADTDGDGMADGLELRLALNPLVADPTTTVQGRVVDADGTPANGVTIVLFNILTVRTDNTGFFSLQFVPASLGQIVATAQIVRAGQVFDGASSATSPSAGGVTDVGSIVLHLNSGNVVGNIFDTLNRPVPNALVTVVTGPDTRTATTDTNGFYRVSNMTVGSVLVTVRDPDTGLRGYANGTLLLNQSAVVNVTLGPWGSVAGTVFGRDGVTPVTLGRAVTMSSSIFQSTLTDELGKYRYAFVPLGSYTADATDTNANHGRTSGNISATAQVNVSDITYLGRGVVTGTVRDGSQNPVPGASISLTSSSVFGGAATASTDSAGRYTISNIFVGPFSILAFSTTTRLSGQANGLILFDGQVVTIGSTGSSNSIVLASSGSITGLVYRADGVTPVTNVQVSISALGLTTASDSSGRYRFDYVPLGPYTLNATDPVTGDRGRVGATLSAQDEVRAANLTLNGLGTVTVTVRDGATNLVPNAQVVLTGTTQFGGTQSGITGTNGTVVLNGILAGSFNVSATDPASGLSGSTSGGVAVGASVSVTVSLQPSGTINGFVFQPDGSNGAPGITVRISGQVYRTTTTAPDGSYQFGGVPTSTYSVDALDSGGNLRARVTGATIASQGQIVRRDLILIGLGTVRGIVYATTPSNTVPVSGLGVSVSSQVPNFGRSFYVQTDINGQYSASGVPIGNFTATASGQVGQIQYYGATQSVMTANAAIVNADIPVSSALVPSTVTLYDANNFGYQLRENGSIQDGSPGSMYGGNFNSNRGGFLLDLITGGTTNRFAGSPFAGVEESGREIVIRQDGLGGLNVTRKMYVPHDGYFVRYLEFLNNPSAGPVTATVKLTSNFRFISKVQNGFTFNREPRIISTSSGDATLDISNSSTRDHWAVLDDDDDGDPFLTPSTLPAVADLFEGTNGVSPVSSAQYQIDFTNNFGQLTEQWTNITIPAGGTVAFMHFGTEQTGRGAARASVERLLRVPPEAIAGMTAQELAQVQNFSLPTNGASSLPALPSLVGNINGRTLAGDGSNVIANASVRFRSTNVLFGRTYTFNANGDGQFNFTGLINDSGSSVAVPVGGFTLTGVHPLTGGLSPVATGQFGVGLVTAMQDVVFLDTGNLVGTVRRHNNVVVSSGTVQVSGGALIFPVSLNIAVNGAFELNGLPAGSYTLIATVPIAQGSALTAALSATIVSGLTTTRVILMPDTGTLVGTLRRSDNSVVVNNSVVLRGASGLTRNVVTDTGGRFTFFDVPAGAVTLDAYESFSNTAAHAQTNTIVDQTIVQNLTLISGGTVAGLVLSPTSLPVVGALVTLTASNGVFTATTGSDGRYQFNVVSPGNVSVRAVDSATTLRGQSSGLLALSGQTLTLNVSLVAAGSVSGVVYHPDATTPIAGAAVQMFGNLNASVVADSLGRYAFDFVPLGNFTVRGTDPTNTESGLVISSLVVNGETRVANIVVVPNLSITDASVTEGNIGGSNIVFNVRLSSPSLQEVRVNYAASGGSAFLGGDFQAAFGTLIFSPGNTNLPVNVIVNGDTAIEPDEIFYLNLSASVNSTITRSQAVGTILNDDGFPGQIDHFVWANIPSPEFVGQPFAVTITAQDAFNNVLSNYPGPVRLSGVSGTADAAVGAGNVSWTWPLASFYHDARCQSIYYASEIGSARQINGLALDVTGVPGQTLNNWTIRMKHTALAGYGVSPGWDGGGWTVVYQTNLTVSATGQILLPFTAPFDFNGVDNLMIDFSFNNGSYSNDGATRSTDTALNRSLYFRTDSGFGDPLTWTGNTSPAPSVIARIPNVRLLSSISAIALSPTNSGTFVNGLWTGNLTLQQLATNLTLRADDGNGHNGISGAFQVLVQNDLSVVVSDSPDPVSVGANLTYTINVTNSGPSSATGVTVTNFLPAAVTFVSAVSSQGTCTNVSGIVRCDLGTLTGASGATVTIVVTPVVSGNITNRAAIGRNEADPYPANNVATSVTTVLQPFLTIDDVSVVEGNVGTTSLIFNVRLSYPSSQTVTMAYASSNLTAVAGGDYTSVSGILSFAPGATNQTITVNVAGDTFVELDETFAVNLSNATNALLSDALGIGTIVNDDGLPGAVSRFQWNAIPSPQYVNEPFAVGITALDALGLVVSNFTGPVNLSGFRGGGLQTNFILGNLSGLTSFTGTYSIGYAFTPSTNLLVTHVRHLCGTKVSIWTDTGALLVSQSVTSISGVWTETPLTVPLALQAGVRYRVAFYQPSGTIYYTSPVPTTFTNGTIQTIYYSSLDEFPTATTSGSIYPVDLRYTTGTQSPAAIAPTVSGNFANGIWNGSVSVSEAFDIGNLRATDGNGHSGDSTNFAALYRNDLFVRAVGTPNPVSVGLPLSYAIGVTNTGPNAATGVKVTNLLSANVVYQSVVPSQGTATLFGNSVVCSLGTIAGGASATVALVVTPTAAGVASNVISISRAEADAYVSNNLVTVSTVVLTPSVSIGSVSLTEGNSGTNNAVFNVQLSYPSLQTITVNYATSNQTAVAGSDYIATNGFLTIPPGVTNGTIVVRVIGDITPEPNETFAVRLSSPVNAVLGDSVGVGTILDDEFSPDGYTLVTENCSGGNGVIDPGETVSVTFFARNRSPNATTALTATLLASDNVVNPSGAQNLGSVPAGSTAGATFSFTASGQCGGNFSPTFQLLDGTNSLGLLVFNVVFGIVTTGSAENFDTLTAPALPAGWIATATGAGTPWRTVSSGSDTAPNAVFCPDPSSTSSSQLTSPSIPITSSAAQLTFRHRYNTESCCDGGTLQISIGGGGFQDILTAGGSFVVGAYNNGQRWAGNSGTYITTQVQMPPAAVGQNVQFRWNFTTDSSVAGEGWYLDSIQGVVTANCCVPTNAVDLVMGMSATPSSVVVGNTIRYTIGVTNRGPNQATSVAVTNQLPAGVVFVSGTAPVGCTNIGNLVVCQMGNLTNGGSAIATIVVNAPATNGTMIVSARVISAESELNFADNRATLTNSVILPALNIVAQTVLEGNSGFTNLTYQVQLSAPVPLPVSVAYFTGNGTALQGSDYVATNGVLVFGPGETNKTINVQVIGDTLNEQDEYLYVYLSTATNATFNNSSAFAYILNDDPLALLAINDVSILEGNVGTTNAVFAVTLTPISGQTVSVSYTTANGTATNGADFFGATGTLTFAPGQTNQFITNSVIGDTAVEADETYFVTLSNPANAAFSKSQGVATIINDDGFPGQLDHFVWGALAPTQFVSAPFVATVTAKDYFNVTVSNYNGVASVRGLSSGGALVTNSILSNAVPTSSSSGTYTMGYAFTPSTNITITHVRHIHGTKVSIWTDAGVLVASQNVVSSPGTWIETPLAVPVQLLAGQKYRIGAYTGGGVWYYLQNPPATFANGTIQDGYYISADAFPNSAAIGYAYLADVRYTIGIGSEVPVAPNNLTGLFTNGTWSGTMSVGAPATNVVLAVSDGNGHQGLTSPMDVRLTNDLSVSIVASPVPADVRSNLTYTITVFNSGPITSTAVTLTNTLPAEVNFLSAVSSQGACVNAGRLVICTLGNLTAGSTATITINVKPVLDSITLTNLCQISRAEPEFYLANNAAVTATPVRSLFGGGGKVAIFGAAPVSYNNDVTNKVGSTHLFAQVDGAALTTFTPTLSQLQQYDAVLVYSDNGFLDNVGLGNALADYVDAGGGVVVATFAFSSSGSLSIQGRLLTGGYLPFTTAGQSGGNGLTLVKDDPQDPILNGVNLFNGGASSYHNSIAVTAGSKLVAHWSNGQPLVGTRQASAGRVAGLNFYPPSSDAGGSSFWTASTDGARLMANTIAWASAKGGVVPDDLAVKAAVSAGTFGLGSNLVYNVVLTNTGPSLATGVFVTNTLSLGTSLLAFTATQGSFYTNTAGALVCNVGTVPPGTNVTLTITARVVLAGTLVETVAIGRAEPDAYLRNNTATLTVNIPVSLNITGTSVVEGNVGLTSLPFTVSLSAPSTQPVSVGYYTGNGTALSGSDYIATNGALVFAPGETNKIVNVLVIGDTSAEPSESLFVYLSSPTNATLLNSGAGGTILNDDSQSFASINSVSVAEGNSGTTSMIFIVRLAATNAVPLFVDYFSYDGSAVNGSDYLGVEDTLVFAPGETNKVITVPIVGDNLSEPNETFFIEVYNPFTFELDSVGIGTIIDDDGVADAAIPLLGTLQIKSVANGVVNLEMTSANTGSCVIEVSTDLLHWQPLCTNTIANGKLQATDPTATNAARFYRARW